MPLPPGGALRSGAGFSLRDFSGRIGFLVLPSDDGSAREMTKPRLPGFFWARALFPSWRFFEKLGDLPQLHFRMRRAGGDFGNWVSARRAVPRGAGAILLHAEGNLALACNTLLEQLVSDLGDHEAGEVAGLSENVSYRLVRNLVEFRIREGGFEPAPFEFQFKVTSDSEDFLVSGIHGG